MKTLGKLFNYLITTIFLHVFVMLNIFLGELTNPNLYFPVIIAIFIYGMLFLYYFIQLLKDELKGEVK